MGESTTNLPPGSGVFDEGRYPYLHISFDTAIIAKVVCFVLGFSSVVCKITCKQAVYSIIFNTWKC